MKTRAEFIEWLFILALGVLYVALGVAGMSLCYESRAKSNVLPNLSLFVLFALFFVSGFLACCEQTRVMIRYARERRMARTVDAIFD